MTIPTALAEGTQSMPPHPRLLVTAEGFERLRQRVNSDSISGEWYGRMHEDAEKIIPQPPSKYELPDGVRLLPISRQVLSRIYVLGMVFKLSGDERFARRAWDELQAAANFPSWHPPHFLDTAEMTHAFAIGYDWLYDYWTDEQRGAIRNAILNFGLTPGLNAYGGQASYGWWVTSTNNWNIVCNGGLGMGALAVYDEATDTAKEVISSGLASLPTALVEYAPDGAYSEGVGSYWGYATKYLSIYLASMETALGTDHDLSQAEGISETGYFPIYLTGPTGLNFNYYDAGTATPQPPAMFWLANKFGKPVYSWWGRLGADTSTDPRYLIWYDPDSYATPREAGLATDRYFRKSEVVTFRSAWQDPEALFVGFKGGDNNTNHGDLDLGTFVLEAMGVRFADELGSDNYNLPGYFDMGSDGQRWIYYRKNAEGQNTLVINPDSDPGQDPTVIADIVRHGFAPSEAFAIADLTKAYGKSARSVRRGIRVFDFRRQTLVQDEIQADDPADVWWFMHTSASVEIAPSGRSAILTKQGKRLLAKLVSPDEATFVLMDAKPLWTSPDPDGQNSNHGLRKLAVHMENVTNARLAVQLVPLREWEKVHVPPPRIEPLSKWSVPGGSPSVLSGISIDGKSLETFVPESFTYDLQLPKGTTRVPTVEATPAEDGSRVKINAARNVPGTTTIEVGVGPDKTVYTVYFHLPSEVLEGLPVSSVNASADDGNVPANTLDNDLSTRWSAEGDGQWIRYDLGEVASFKSIAIAWYKGDTRLSFFDVEVSNDASTWDTVYSGQSSGTTVLQEDYSLGDVSARYVRIVGHGNSDSAWNSITEVDVLDRVIEQPQPPVELDEVTLSAPVSSVKLGDQVQLTLSARMSDGSDADLSEASVRYVSDDERVATVSPEGVVTGRSEGTARISGIVLLDRVLKYDSVELPVDDPSLARLTPVGDSYVNDGARADDNYGGSTTLLIKNTGNVDDGYNRETFLKFELGSITEQIEWAKLYVYGAVRDSQGSEIDIEFHAVSDDWREGSLTWNTKPETGEYLASAHVDSTFQWSEVDVTNYVKQEAAGDGVASFVVLENQAPDVTGLAVQVRSREDTANGPYLKIKHTV